MCGKTPKIGRWCWLPHYESSATPRIMYSPNSSNGEFSIFVRSLARDFPTSCDMIRANISLEAIFSSKHYLAGLSAWNSVWGDCGGTLHGKHYALWLRREPLNQGGPHVEAYRNKISWHFSVLNEGALGPPPAIVISVCCTVAVLWETHRHKIVTHRFCMSLNACQPPNIWSLAPTQSSLQEVSVKGRGRHLFENLTRFQDFIWPLIKFSYAKLAASVPASPVLPCVLLIWLRSKNIFFSEMLGDFVFYHTKWGVVTCRVKDLAQFTFTCCRLLSVARSHLFACTIVINLAFDTMTMSGE